VFFFQRVFLIQKGKRPSKGTQKNKLKMAFYKIKKQNALHLPQLKRDYALNLNISVSAAQKKKLTRIPLVTASE